MYLINTQNSCFTLLYSYVLINLSHIKGGIITLYERILKERSRLQTQIDAIRTELQTLPDGKLICSQNNNQVKWYQSDGHTKTYIPKKDRTLAEQLAKKKFLTLTLEDLTHEQRALDFYLSHHSKTQEKLNIYLQKFKVTENYSHPIFKQILKKF